MAVTVKQKIRSGTLFLFFMLLLSGGVGIYYVVRLKDDANMILKNNYESLDYCHAMLLSLDDYYRDPRASVAGIDSALSKQERNVTEPGEREATVAIRQMTDSLQRSADSGLGRIHPVDSLVLLSSSMPPQFSSRSPELVIDSLHRSINSILNSNMLAIEAKNQRAARTADQALLIIGLLAGLILLIGVSFTYNFPAIVTGPIAALTSGIQEISRRNYKYRIHIDNRDEFGDMATAFNSMAERLETFENSNLNKIIFEKTRAEAVINSLKDASIGIDKNNIVLFANDQALQLLGLQAKDIVSKPVNEITRRNDLFAFLLGEQNNLPFKIIVEQRENYFIKEVMEINQDEQQSRVIILRNITSFKELDVAKTNFIATISHELKTPLASSDISLKLLEDSRVSVLTDEQRELIRNLKLDNQRMLRILSELLNMSQVESGRIQLDVRPSDAVAIALTSIETVMNPAKARRIRIDTLFENNLPKLLADAGKTGWVLNNFLVNAVKHSKEDSEISVSINREGPQLVFKVTDHGTGIPAEFQPKIFDRFFTVPGSKSKGTGLGLSISKEFIEAQGGNIWVKSEPGAGSVFGFGLPVAE